MSSYTVNRADRAASPVAVGATVFTCRGWDYGCANEDTRRLGLEHVAVTLDSTGDYPFFTIPRADLTALPGEHPTPSRRVIVIDHIGAGKPSLAAVIALLLARPNKDSSNA